MQKIFLLALFVTVTNLAIAQTDVVNIKQLLAAQTTAWNNGDLDGFMQTYWKSDSLLFVGKNGPKYGWQTTLDNYKKSYATRALMGTLNFDILQIKPLGNKQYFVLGKWHLTRTAGDVGGHFTLILKKFKDGWKIICDHSS